MELTASWVGYLVLVIFVVAYALVIVEELTGLRKSIPVMLAAALIWATLAFAYRDAGAHIIEEAISEFLVEFSQLFLFLLVAMTYINAMTERRVFDALRAWLARRGLNLRALFWATGALSFFLSPLIDNLTTALVMAAIVLAAGGENRRFVAVACINIVVAANAGGAFSPFGDITTLMVWQAGYLGFSEFFALFLPALISYLVPAVCLSLGVPASMPEGGVERIALRRGAVTIMLLFAGTVTLAVTGHNFLHLPPFLGMVVGLALLQLFGFYLNRTHVPLPDDVTDYRAAGDVQAFDGFAQVARAEWDTLLFFFGVIMCVGGVGFVGYLATASVHLYGTYGPTVGNTLVGLMSAIVDNIPVMVAVLHMSPSMDDSQWLLVTLTAGIGGSLLSIGSAAGVALMGQARQGYTFLAHLRWTPVIAVGYAAGIGAHLWISG